MAERDDLPYGRRKLPEHQKDFAPLTDEEFRNRWWDLFLEHMERVGHDFSKPESRQFEREVWGFVQRMYSQRDAIDAALAFVSKLIGASGDKQKDRETRRKWWLDKAITLGMTLVAAVAGWFLQNLGTHK